MTDDLVKRLRSDAHMIQADGLGAMLGTAAEAADRIEALTTANTGLHDEIEDLREKLATAYIALSGTTQHASDCATSNAPAYEPGPCDCKEAEQ